MRDIAIFITTALLTLIVGVALTCLAVLADQPPTPSRAAGGWQEAPAPYIDTAGP